MLWTCPNMTLAVELDVNPELWLLSLAMHVITLWIDPITEDMRCPGRRFCYRVKPLSSGYIIMKPLTYKMSYLMMTFDLPPLLHPLNKKNYKSLILPVQHDFFTLLYVLSLCLPGCWKFPCAQISGIYPCAQISDI